jgi:hypothetical protein
MLATGNTKRFQRTVVSKMTLFWDVSSCSLVQVYRHFRHNQSNRPYGEGCKHLWNVSKLLTDNKAQQPRRQSTSNPSPCEPEISNINNFISSFCGYLYSTYIFIEIDGRQHTKEDGVFHSKLIPSDSVFLVCFTPKLKNKDYKESPCFSYFSTRNASDKCLPTNPVRTPNLFSK